MLVENCLCTQVVEALHAKDDDSNIPLKPLEAMLSIDLAHPNIIHTFKFYTRIRQVRSCTLLLPMSHVLHSRVLQGQSLSFASYHSIFQESQCVLYLPDVSIAV